MRSDLLAFRLGFMQYGTTIGTFKSKPNALFKQKNAPFAGGSERRCMIELDLSVEVRNNLTLISLCLVMSCRCRL